MQFDFELLCWVLLKEASSKRSSGIKKKAYGEDPLFRIVICRAILPAWGAGPYLPAIVLERPIFVREVSDGLYTAFTYLVYKVVHSCLKHRTNSNFLLLCCLCQSVSQTEGADGTLLLFRIILSLLVALF